ncbi:MAG: Rhs element Vgr protein [Alphaproteobacteria bacterium]|nr:Rhs element Vgr protein [Alphaproteobacteria bacterium]
MQNLDIGVVIDTNDPTGDFRVRVMIPSVLADQPVWARVCQSNASDSFCLPETGDQVLVGFIGGDLDMPVLLGNLSSPERPPATPPGG